MIIAILANLYIFKISIMKKLIIIPIIFLVIYLVYRYDVFGVKVFIESSRWYIKILNTIENGILVDPRFTIYGLVKNQIFDYTFGGYQMDLGGLSHAHNMWLDVLYTAGIYPFFMLIAYTFMTATTIVRTIHSKFIEKNMKILILSIFIGINLHFLVEPILDGVPYWFSMFCLINGVTYQYLVTRNEMKIVNN
jgi:hypothetical protein